MGGTIGMLVKELIAAAAREGMDVEIRFKGGPKVGPVARSFAEAERMGMFGSGGGDDPGAAGHPAAR